MSLARKFSVKLLVCRSPISQLSGNPSPFNFSHIRKNNYLQLEVEIYLHLPIHIKCAHIVYFMYIYIYIDEHI